MSAEMERLFVRDYGHLRQLVDEAVSRGGSESLNHLDIRAVKTLVFKLLFQTRAHSGISVTAPKHVRTVWHEYERDCRVSVCLHSTKAHDGNYT